MYDQKYAKQLCNLLQERFYQSKPWRNTRRHALLIYGAKCHCCGAAPTKRKPLHVDHIKPRSKFPELALSMTNLQVLCEHCNSSKSNVKIVDYRSEEDKTYATMYTRGTNVRTILIEQKQGILNLKGIQPMNALGMSRDVATCNNKKKKTNPNTVKDTRTKKQKRKQANQFRTIQQQFLETIRTLKTAKEVSEFVDKCKLMLGVEITQRLVAICNVSHKLDR